MTGRLYSGVVQMREDTLGNVSLFNEHWCGWFASQEAAVGAWVIASMAKHPKAFVAWQSAYDITDVALMQLKLPA